MIDKRKIAIQEVSNLKRKLHLYNEDNRDLVEKRIKELTIKYNITYGDLWNEKRRM